MKTRSKILILAIISLILAPFIVPLFDPWNGINCREQEIDVLSGLRKDTRYIYWIPVSNEISSTPLSKALSVDEETTEEHQWHRVNSFGPYLGNSPHYIYHSAFAQITLLAYAWEAYAMGAPERIGTAQGLLSEWQLAGTDETANDYISGIMKKAEQASAGNP